MDIHSPPIHTVEIPPSIVAFRRIESELPDIMEGFINLQRAATDRVLKAQPEGSNRDNTKSTELLALINDPERIKTLVEDAYIRPFIDMISSFSVLRNYRDGIIRFTGRPLDDALLNKIIVPIAIKNLYNKRKEGAFGNNDIDCLYIILLAVPSGIDEEVRSLNLDPMPIVESIKNTLESNIKDLSTLTGKDKFIGLSLFYGDQAIYENLMYSLMRYLSLSESGVIPEISPDLRGVFDAIYTTISDFQSNPENQKAYVQSYADFLSGPYGQSGFFIEATSHLDALTDLYLGEPNLFTDDEKRLYEESINSVFSQQVIAILQNGDYGRPRGCLNMLGELFKVFLKWNGYTQEEDYDESAILEAFMKLVDDVLAQQTAHSDALKESIKSGLSSKGVHLYLNNI